jgi:hypothetical protein
VQIYESKFIVQPDFFNDDVRRETDKARVLVKPHHSKFSVSAQIWAAGESETGGRTFFNRRTSMDYFVILWKRSAYGSSGSRSAFVR